MLLLAPLLSSVPAWLDQNSGAGRPWANGASPCLPVDSNDAQRFSLPYILLASWGYCWQSAEGSARIRSFVMQQLCAVGSVPRSREGSSCGRC